MYILRRPSTRAPAGEVYFRGDIASLTAVSGALLLVGGESFFPADAVQIPREQDAEDLCRLLDNFAVNATAGWTCVPAPAAEAA